SLNPALRIGSQLSEAWRAHATGTQSVCSVAISNALSSVSLPNDADFLRRLPGQLSVGQAQRVIIAMAILHRPGLLIADEATSALDTITQSEILGLFARLNRELGMGILYISHDLLSVAALCHRIAILNAGEIVECGPPSQLFGAPRHAYTPTLAAALPRLPDFSTQPSPAEPLLIRAQIHPQSPITRRHFPRRQSVCTFLTLTEGVKIQTDPLPLPKNRTFLSFCCKRVQVME